MDVVWTYQNEHGAFRDSTGKTRNLTMITKDEIGYQPELMSPSRRRSPIR
jgi:hypothetical protein